MVEEVLAARGIIVSHETVRQWARKFGQAFANQIRRRLPGAGDKWHLDKVIITIAGVKHWLWRAVDQTGIVLDVLVQRRRDKQAAKRLLRKLLKRQGRAPRVMITDKLASYSAAKRDGDAERRTSPASGPRQPSREFASADKTARTADEEVQVGRPGTTVSLSTRPDQQPLPSSSRLHPRLSISDRSSPGLRDLGRRDRCGIASAPAVQHPRSLGSGSKLTVPRPSIRWPMKPSPPWSQTSRTSSPRPWASSSARSICATISAAWISAPKSSPCSTRASRSTAYSARSSMDRSAPGVVGRRSSSPPSPAP